ncbi:MAG: MerR family transcriptional regulator [Chloroflexota bacterium]
MDELIPIGRFARLSGLSVGALRHYDELDLLRPAETDGWTGYRRYRREQLETARTIARLRELEVPLDEIRAVLAVDDPDERSRLLAAHRARIEARTNRLQRVLHHVSQVVDRREPIVTKPPAPPELDPVTERAVAVGLFNHVWTLLERPDRSREQDDEMVHAAHASRYHWGVVGEPLQRAIGEWQCSRVYATLGRGEPAVHHGRRCLEIAEEHELERWLFASAFEGLARAHAAAGDRRTAEEWKGRAEAAVRDIEEPEERQIVEGDIATLPV